MKKKGWFDKYCEKCGMKVNKKIAPQRFGKYFAQRNMQKNMRLI